MKRYLAIALLALALASARAGDAVRWLSTVHDFGAFDEDMGKVTAAFEFVNDSDSAIAIIQAAATCGCTAPRYSSDPVLPGDTAKVFVTYDPAGRPGRFEKQVYVRTSAQSGRDKLVVKGVVIGQPKTLSGRYPVEMGPLRLRTGLAMLGKVNAGAGKMDYIEGCNVSRDSLSIAFSGVPDYLQASTVPETVGPGDNVSINLYFRGDRCKEWGLLSDSIKVRINGELAFDLPYVVIVEEDFSALTPEQLANAPVLKLEDDRVDIGPVPVGSAKPVTVKVEVKNAGKSTLRLRRVYSQDPAVQVKASKDAIKPGKTADITIIYDPASQPEGVINTRLTIISNDPSAPTRTVRIVGDRE